MFVVFVTTCFLVERDDGIEDRRGIRDTTVLLSNYRSTNWYCCTSTTAAW